MRWMLLILGVALSCSASADPILKWDGTPQAEVRNLRTTDDRLPKGSSRGLDLLHASGSDQFTLEGLQAMARKLTGHRVFLVDLRQEAHGFLNGRPVSWFGPQNHANLHQDLDHVLLDETNRLSELRQASLVHVFTKGEGATEAVPVQSVEAERAAAASVGWDYLRLPVADHMRPEDPVVDEFVHFACHVPDDAWLHFHCAGGRGRTSTFLTMWDMMHNAGDVTMEAILAREADLGGEDMTALPVSGEKHDWAVDRLTFLQTFYRYCQENKANQYATSWSQWLVTQR